MAEDEKEVRIRKLEQNGVRTEEQNKVLMDSVSKLTQSVEKLADETRFTNSKVTMISDEWPQVRDSVAILPQLSSRVEALEDFHRRHEDREREEALLAQIERAKLANTGFWSSLDKKTKITIGTGLGGLFTALAGAISKMAGLW